MAKDHEIPAVRMDQSMAVAASMVIGLIGTFRPVDATDKEIGTASLICLSVFLHQLLTPAQQKAKVAGILRALIIEMEDPPFSNELET